jgi:hypothetical protein
VETGLSVTVRALSLPDADALAALRAWHEGLSSRDAVTRYLGEARSAGQSSRGVIGAIRHEIAAFARSRHRGDLAKLFSPAWSGSCTETAFAAGVPGRPSRARRSLLARSRARVHTGPEAARRVKVKAIVSG